MPDSILSELFKSGRHLLLDTKAPRKIPPKTTASKAEVMGMPTESDPHKLFIRRCVMERPKKNEIVDDIKRFIKAAEETL